MSLLPAGLHAAACALIGLLSAGFVFIASLPAEAQSRGKRSAPPIRIAYVEPKNAEHRPIYERLKSARVLEHIRGFLAPVRLPSRLTLRVEGCDGVVNAWYHDGAVIVCYEYIAEAVRNAPQQPVGEITRASVIVGAVVDVFLHELAHALFDLLEIPILGREEDAADQVAAYIMLQMGPEDARRIIAGAAYLYAIDALKTNVALKDFADTHGLPAQRFFNLLCMAYGADAKRYADIVERGILPKSRAEGCADEYAQVALAFEKLIVPHMDRKQRARIAAQVRSGKWRRLIGKLPGL